MALATGELMGGLGGVITGTSSSLLGAVGDWFIDSGGRPLAAPAVSTLGSASKPTLVAGIVVVLERSALRSGGTHRVLAVARPATSTSEEP